MLYIKNIGDGLELFKALGSELRIKIIEMLIEEGSLSMHEIAERLNITDGALTSHMKKLEQCGIVHISLDTIGHGNQKMCSVHLDRILIDVEVRRNAAHVYETSVKVGQFTDYEVFPTCGIATSKKIIGAVDESRYFSDPERYKADILWFAKGFVEYQIPNLIPANSVIDELTVTAELGSEAPGFNTVWPSDVYFYLNDTYIGMWTLPGDFGDVKGIFTPNWWFANWNQYGVLKMLVLNNKGTFVDGIKISDVTVDSLGLRFDSKLIFRMEVPEAAQNVGGLTIYGKSFGNYDQDINIKIRYNTGDENDK